MGLRPHCPGSAGGAAGTRWPAPPLRLTLGPKNLPLEQVDLGRKGDDAACLDGLDLKLRTCGHRRRRGNDPRRRAAFQLKLDHLDDAGVTVQVDEALFFSDAVR